MTADVRLPFRASCHGACDQDWPLKQAAQTVQKALQKPQTSMLEPGGGVQGQDGGGELPEFVGTGFPLQKNTQDNRRPTRTLAGEPFG